MKTEQAAFAKRLSGALQAAGVEASPKLLEGLLARYGGTPVTPQAISGWLSGKHLPKQANMRALARIVNLEPFELQYGSRLARGVREAIPEWLDGVAAVDRLAAEDFLRLPPQQRKLVRELIDTLSARETRSGRK